MKTHYFLIFFLLCTCLGFAQSTTVAGSVKEAETGFPVPGANVVVKDSNLSTTTDLDGNFVLNDVPVGAVLVFSYLGYKDVNYSVTSSGQPINILFNTDEQALQEVVVIGYGSQRRRDVTGSVSIVNSETVQAIRPVLVSQALQGTVTGVNVSHSSGAPGASTIIRIRGIATNGENRPIVIIDGYQGELDLINPYDIETITVLKDAQAAIYGTIGANGIILITTKKGRRNSKARISYNTYTGFQETSRKLPLLNATEYALLLNESYASGGMALPFPNVSNLGTGTDWQDEVFSKSVPIISHDLSFSGGSDKITYSVSGSHLDQEGIVGEQKSGFLRNTARLALDADVSDRLKLSTNVIYTYFTRRTLNESGLGSVLFNAINSPATLPAFQENGDFSLIPNTTGLGNEIINPLAQIANTFNDYNYKKVNGTFGLTYELRSDLNVTGRIGFNSSNSESRSFSPQISYGGKVFDNPRSSVTQGAVNDNNYSFDLFADYKKIFAENHNLGLTVGTTIFKEYGNGLYATGFDVPGNTWANADLDLADGPSVTDDSSSYTYDERRLSYFARFQYDFKGRYLLSGMLRRDSSTKFGPNNRVAYFPSATAGWIISDEEFFGDSKILSFLKFRASYGILGNDQIPANGYVSYLTGEAVYPFDGSLLSGVATGQIPNPNLKWEEAKKFDIGVDMRLLSDKVGITIDYFNDVRDDLLIPGLPVSGIIGIGAPGAAPPTVNAGSVKNYGFEFAINYKDKIGKDFSFDVNYNLTVIKNTVLEVNNGTGILETGAFSVGQPVIARMQQGHTLGYFYGYQTDGIFQNQAEVDAHASQAGLGAPVTAPGDIRYVDRNNDGVIDSADKTDVGDPIPAAVMGFNFTLGYKNFDLTAFSFANIGNEMVRNYERVLSDANRLDYVLDRWTGEGTSNTVPRVTTNATNNNVFSDYFVEDASFLRIQKVELGYTIDPKILEKAGMTKVRIYAAVNNLYTFTKYKGYDPSATNGAPIGGGIDFGFYPVPRTFLLGASVNF